MAIQSARAAMAYRGSMSDEELDDIVKTTFSKLSQVQEDGLRMVLVEGYTVSAAASELSVTRQILSRNVVRVYKAFLVKEKNIKPCPDGWVERRICAPPQLMSTFQNMIKEAKLAL